ncbi:Solute carrier family 35 member F1 [Labeo rohita]|uniref:Solute carrier family 35 member F1 n=1 Tax=Labeo rohita TaxID=84645 RepID=A0ABQ8LNF7_LABRO|nr:Solute carrier family 35 member F1 [Labeo rohita]
MKAVSIDLKAWLGAFTVSSFLSALMAVLFPFTTRWSEAAVGRDAVSAITRSTPRPFSGLYLLSFFIIILGLILYSSSSTYVAQDPRVYKQFRNAGNAITDTPTVGPLEPSVTYTSLGQEIEEEPRIRVA